MISGEVLKYLNGGRWVIRLAYRTGLLASTDVPLTPPTGLIFSKTNSCAQS